MIQFAESSASQSNVEALDLIESDPQFIEWQPLNLYLSTNRVRDIILFL